MTQDDKKTHIGYSILHVYICIYKQQLKSFLTSSIRILQYLHIIYFVCTKRAELIVQKIQSSLVKLYHGLAPCEKADEAAGPGRGDIPVMYVRAVCCS